MATGPERDATVKWFNPEKGFGFAELADGSGDAFLHIAALQAAGGNRKEAAALLGVSRATLCRHLAKLGLTSRTQAAIFATKHPHP